MMANGAGFGADMPGGAYPRPLVAWFTTSLLLLLYLVSVLDRNIIALLVEPIKFSLHLTDVELSLITGGAFALIYTFASLPLGWAMDRFPRRPIVWGGVTVWSLSTMACGLSANAPSMLVARAGVGAGESALVPASQSIIPDLFPKDKLALPFTIYTLGGALGAGASLLVGGFLTSVIDPMARYDMAFGGTMGGWQLIFICAGLPGLLIGLLIFAAPEPVRRRLPTDDEADRSYIAYFRFIGRNFRFIACGHIGHLLALSASLAFIAWTPAYLSRVHHLDTSHIGYWLGSVMAVGALIGLPLHGTIVDRWFRRGRRDSASIYMSLLAIACVPALAVAFLTSNPTLAIVMMGIANALQMGFTGLTKTALQLMVPDELRGKAASMNLLLVSLAANIVGPSGVATLTDHGFGQPTMIGYSMLTYSAIAMPLAALMFFLSAKPMRERLSFLPAPETPRQP